jgi:hypothetical protein
MGFWHDYRSFWRDHRGFLPDIGHPRGWGTSAAGASGDFEIDQTDAGMQAWRDMILKGRDLLPPHMIHRPDYDSYERRFYEMIRLLREGTPEAWDRAEELINDIQLDHTADMAAATSEISERMVRFNDELAHRVEEKKFELSSEARDELDEMLLPYQDGYREEMLGRLPI